MTSRYLFLSKIGKTKKQLGLAQNQGFFHVHVVKKCHILFKTKNAVFDSLLLVVVFIPVEWDVTFLNVVCADSLILKMT